MSYTSTLGTRQRNNQVWKKQRFFKDNFLGMGSNLGVYQAILGHNVIKVFAVFFNEHSRPSSSLNLAFVHKCMIKSYSILCGEIKLVQTALTCMSR